jgi:hypothetical protein
MSKTEKEHIFDEFKSHLTEVDNLRSIPGGRDSPNEVTPFLLRLLVEKTEFILR